MDAYPLVGRDGVFANAQTENAVLKGIEAATEDSNQTMRHAFSILAL